MNKILLFSITFLIALFSFFQLNMITYAANNAPTAATSSNAVAQPTGSNAVAQPTGSNAAAQTSGSNAAVAQPTASNSVAQVVWVKGSVKAVAQQSPRDLQRRSPIFQQDTIVTTTASSGQIVFTDGGVVAIKENTSLVIKEYKYNKAAPSQDKMVFTLAKGGFRTITGAISKNNPGSVKINTPVGTIGIRGSDVVVAITPANKAAIQVNVGSATLTNLENKTLVIDASKGVSYATMDGYKAPERVYQQPQVLKAIIQLPVQAAPAAGITPAVKGETPAPAGEGQTPKGSTETGAAPSEGKTTSKGSTESGVAPSSEDKTTPSGESKTKASTTGPAGSESPGATKNVSGFCIQ